MKFIGVSDLITDFYYQDSQLIGVSNGGSCSNIITNLSSFGYECAIISCSGDDKFADICTKSLNKSTITVHNTKLNNVCTKQIHINHSNGKSISTKRCPLCNKKHFYTEIYFDEKNFNIVTAGDIVILDNISNPFISKLHYREIKIMIDIGHESYFKEMSDQYVIEQLSVGYEIVQLNQKVYKYLLKRFNISDITSLIKSKIINITCSDKGNIFYVDGEQKEFLPEKIYNVIDETGAGDAYFSKLIDLYVKNNFKFDDNIPKLCNKYVENVLSTLGATAHIRRLIMVNSDTEKCSCEDVKLKERRKPNRCLININNMLSRINKAIDNYDASSLNKLFNDCKNSNTIVTGSGGSYACAAFISHFLNDVYNVNSFTMYPRDITFRNNSNIYNLICLSYSGTTQDMIYGINNSGIDNVHIITKGKLDKVLEKVKKANIVSYYGANNKSKERGFFSFEGTLSPCSIIMESYLKGKKIDIKSFLESRFNYWKEYFENNLIKFSKNMKLDIIYDYISSSAAFDIESKAVESGCFNVLLHEKKNFSHGRFINVEFNNSDLIIYLKEKNTTKYENVLQEYLGNYLLVESAYDGVLADYDLLLASQLLFYTFAKNGKIDLAKPNYSEDAMKLYFYKGEL